MRSKDIPYWKKLSLLFLELVVIALGIGNFFIYFEPKGEIEQSYGYFLGLVIMTAIAQVVCAWYALKNLVPVYLWTAVGVAIFLTQVWQVLALTLIGRIGA